MTYLIFKVMMSGLILASLIAIKGHACDVYEETEGAVIRYQTPQSRSSLPPEILTRIFVYLDNQSLKACRQASRDFADLVEHVQHQSKNPLIPYFKTRADFDCYLAHHPRYALRRIDVSVQIDPEQLQHLNLFQLVSLKIGQNTLDMSGIQALVQHLTTLTSLDIRDNQIRDAGATTLAQNTILTKLNLNNNKISDAGRQALRLNTKLTDLSVFNQRVNQRSCCIL